MPSPFPGMDPYLEDPRTFPDFHHGVISSIQAVLNRALRPKYVVRVEDRIYLSDEFDTGRQVYIPDARISATGRSSVSNQNQPQFDRETAMPIRATTVDILEIRDHFLKVLDVESREVVTVIEVLSPTNKKLGSVGRKEYLKKRRDLVLSRTHLVEIDLLRKGRSSFNRKILPPHHYAVHVSRSDERPDGQLWPIQLPQRLPVIDIPLKERGERTPLDLQAIVTDAYDLGGNDVVIDYEAPCRPPLPPELEDWARRCIDHAMPRQ